MHRLRTCVANLTADADLCSQLQDLSVSELHELSSITPRSDAVASLYEHYTTISTNEDSTTGILQIFLYYLYFYALAISDSAKMAMLSDGLCNDMLLLALSDLGLTASKPQPLGYFPLQVFIYYVNLLFTFISSLCNFWRLMF